MPLDPGVRLGPYEVVSALGAGGMGEVYRARDRRLQRDVALKILPDLFAADPERLARFEREAQVLASLNHPNIAQIYGVEDSGSVHALVMELVEGETLADRIARGPIPVDEALPIARQIAEALEAAHEQGIIHRDLKPANIKVRDDGTVKVLDFGLAKLAAPANVAGAQSQTLSPTITSPALATGVGVLLGTAAYMSPEQAKGKEADKRSDVWAFGCVLFEMLTGRRAFDGDDVADTLALVLRGTPDVALLPSQLPEHIRVIVTRCLERDRTLRIGEMGTVRFLLTGALPLAASPEPNASRRTTPRRRTLIAMAGVLLLGAATGAALVRAVASPTAPPSLPVTRFAIALGAQLTGAGRQVIAISPAGTDIAYTADDQLYLRSLNQLDAAAVRGTEGARTPFFSPDGQWIGFWQRGQLKRVSITGGAPVVICRATNPLGVNWEQDGTILFGQIGVGILRVSQNGGTPATIVKDSAGLTHGPQLLPGGRAVLYTLKRADTSSWNDADIVVQSLENGRRQVLLHGGTDARYISTGHLVYVTGGTLLAVPFDPATMMLSGGPVSLIDNVAQVPEGPSGSALFAVSTNGSLVYGENRTLNQGDVNRLVWVDREGREEPISAPPRPYVYPRLSPDGTRLAVTLRDADRDIWTWDLRRATLTRLTFDRADDRYEVWTPDNRQIIFGSNRGGHAGTWWQAADGTGAAANLATTSDAAVQYLVPTSIAPDGSRVVVTATAAGGGSTLPDLLVLSLHSVAGPLASARRPDLQPLLTTAAAERNGDISPDGHWLAYESNESGRFEVYVRPFPNVEGGRWQISNGGGFAPLWSRSGGELFYVAPTGQAPPAFVSGPAGFPGAAGELMRVAVDGSSTFRAGAPQRMFSGPFEWSIPAYGGRQYDVTPDGRRFVMLKSADAGATTPQAALIFVQNWFKELEARVSGTRPAGRP